MAGVTSVTRRVVSCDPVEEQRATETGNQKLTSLRIFTSGSIHEPRHLVRGFSYLVHELIFEPNLCHESLKI